MAWWIKARRAHDVLLTGLVVSLLLALAIGGQEVALPSLVAGTHQTVLTMFVPIPLVAALAVSLGSRLPGIESSGVRRIGLWDAGLVAAVLAAWLAAGALTGSGVLLVSGRNAAFLVALMLLARPLAAEAAVMVPVAWTMLVVAFNRRPPPDPEPWTILPEPGSAPHAALATAVLLTAGLVSLQFTHRDSS
ncbi:hypothetical protein [Streptomyces parvus]|uniref:hypothetical protein n=1 Tax=Streptomyces parvus TaxID=66428 RepID=UPI003633EBD5